MSRCSVCGDEIFSNPKLEKLEEPQRGYIFIDKKGMVEYDRDFHDLEKRLHRIDLMGPNGEWVSREFCEDCFSFDIEEKYREFQLFLSEF